MASPTEISVAQLARLIGLPSAPVIIDVRTDEDYNADPRLIPTAIRKDFRQVEKWSGAYSGKQAVVICERGKKLSQGAAAWLRHAGCMAETLEGGFDAWRKAGHMLVNAAKLPAGDHEGRSVWVTRARPKIDRIACPWLIRRFIDPAAVFLFVTPSEVLDVAQRFNAAPFDIDGVFWSHRDAHCTFDTMMVEFELTSEPLSRLATIIRGADNARLDLAPQCAGFLAASLGFSRMFKDDLMQLDAAMILYDALYRWCRDATEETHNWPSNAK